MTVNNQDLKLPFGGSFKILKKKTCGVSCKKLMPLWIICSKKIEIITNAKIQKL